MRFLSIAARVAVPTIGYLVFGSSLMFVVRGVVAGLIQWIPFGFLPLGLMIGGVVAAFYVFPLVALVAFAFSAIATWKVLGWPWWAIIIAFLPIGYFSYELSLAWVRKRLEPRFDVHDVYDEEDWEEEEG